MPTHIQIPEIHPANVGGRSKHEALEASDCSWICPDMSASVYKSSPLGRKTGFAAN